jgi:hypothetical protein
LPLSAAPGWIARLDAVVATMVGVEVGDWR